MLLKEVEMELTKQDEIKSAESQAWKLGRIEAANEIFTEIDRHKLWAGHISITAKAYRQIKQEYAL
jgi:hypothetical protein